METVIRGATLPISGESAPKRSYRLGSGIHVFGRADLIARLQLGPSQCGNCSVANRRPTESADKHVVTESNPASKMPTEVWLLVLAWSGLRTSARAAACCSSFRDLHRTVASTPPLLARALLAEHGPGGAAAHLYGNTYGHPHARHSVRSDDGIAGAIHELLLLSDPSGGAAAFSAATAASSLAPSSAWAFAAKPFSLPRLGHVIPALLGPPFHLGASPATPVNNTPRAPSCQLGSHRCLGGPLINATTTSCSTATPIPVKSTEAVASSPACRDSYSVVCLSPVVTPHAGTLLRAAAAAGHVRVAAAAMGMGARVLDGALVGASGCGRARVVQLLLASGADPDASEPFGPCALFEAARNGHTKVAELLLDAGARVDGVADLPMGYGSTQPAPHPVGAAPGGDGLPPLLDLRTFRAYPRDVGAGSVLAGPEPPLQETAPSNAALSATLTTAPVGSDNTVGSGARSHAPASSMPGLVAALATANSTISAAGATAVGAEGAAGLSRKRRRSSDLGEPRTPSCAVTMEVADDMEPRTPAAASKDLEDGAAELFGNTVGGGTTGCMECCSRAAIARLPPPLQRRRPMLPASLPALPLLPQLPALHTPTPPAPPLVNGPSTSPLMVLWSSHCHCATPLLAACRGGHTGTVALLLRRGARIDLTRGSELMLAGSRGVVNELLAAAPGLAVHLNAALVAAASGNRPDVVAALLEHGADPVVSGGMALNEAAFQGHVGVVATLLVAGGTRLRGSSALVAAHRLAQRWGRGEVVRLLTQAL